MSKVKDLVRDLLQLDQNADICICDIDGNGWVEYDSDNLKKINRNDGYKGYLIIDTNERIRGTVPCEHKNPRKIEW